MAFIPKKTAADNPVPRDLFFPVLLMGMALTGWFAFQSVHLWQEKTALAHLREAQEHVYNDAHKMRAQWEALATGTADLALQGNTHALRIVEEFRRRGFTLSPGTAGAIAPANP